MRQKFVLFDTNVWRHLIDHRRAMETRAILKHAGLKGAVSPLNIDELVKTPVEGDRQALVDLACRRWWTRLLPIGLLDAEQLVEAIRLHRPKWLRADPDLKRWSYERGAYLTTGSTSFWDAVKRNPLEYATANRPNDVVRGIQQQTTRAARAVVPHFDSTQVGKAMLEPIELKLPGTVLDGRSIESWRFQAANSIGLRLDPAQSGPMGALWFDCFVERSRISPADWWAFWANDVTAAEASREWLRCATFHLQAARKAGPGVAGDLALVSHLVDVGYLATCDKPLFEIIERIRPEAPVSLATVLYGRDLPAVLQRVRELGTEPTAGSDQ